MVDGRVRSSNELTSEQKKTGRIAARASTDGPKPMEPVVRQQTASVVAKAVQELLPSLTSPVTNWREFQPQKITIAPYPDMPIEFEATSIKQENGRTVWTGRSAVSGAFLVSAATENDWHATLVIPPAGAFEIHIAGQAVAIFEKNHDRELCGPIRQMIPTESPVATPLVLEASDGAIVATPDDPPSSDVLFFYDAETLVRSQNDPANIVTRLIAHIASSNAALENSGVTNLRWRYVGAYQVPSYAATNDMEHDLDVITGRDDGRAAPNEVSIFVDGKATLHGADQVVLYVGGSRNYGGIAWLSGGASPASLPLAYHSAVVAWSASYMALAHELSHNLGCRHDRETEKVADGDGRFNYGYRFLDRSNRDTGTIMSYANSRVPYFSNPSITFDGYVLGMLETAPKAANNARVLREAATAMIQSRPAVAAPTINNDVQSVTVNEGQNFTLSIVGAGGSSLTYQWRRFSAAVGGTGLDIAGATSASYTKTGAAQTDAGFYAVVLSNVAGQTQSAVATVTVNTPGQSVPQPSTTSPTSGSTGSTAGGGGGGGGAVDGWYAVAGGLLFLLRCAIKRRTV